MMNEEKQVHHGSCLCGNVQYQTSGPLKEVVACHCTQCRKSTGHFFASTDVKKSDLSMVKDETLRWYQGSPGYKRGFCSNCGSSLFWHAEDHERIAILAGTFDGPIGVQMKMHIYTANKGDYYELDEDLPKYPEDHP